MSEQDPTADYRKYPKGPNFLGIVIGSAVVILIIIVITLIFLKHDASKVIPHAHSATPNSSIQPLLPASTLHAA